MKRAKSQTRWLLVSILIVASLLSYFGYRYFFPAPTVQRADIFMITSDLKYGDTTVEGILRKDSPVGVKGQYMIVLDDLRPILLDVVGVDSLLGQKVTAKGYLSPGEGELPIMMSVSSIEASFK